jgi:hypothetical protein
MPERVPNDSTQPETASLSQAEDISVYAWAAMLALVAFLLWGTGFATDDYVHLLQGLTGRIADNWWPKDYISLLFDVSA